MSRFQLNCFGAAELWGDNTLIAFRTRKTQALLIYLAVEGGVSSRETLTTLFWPEGDEQQGRGMLRNTLAYLRQALGDASDTLLTVDRQTVSLSPNGELALDLQRVLVAYTLITGNSPATPERSPVLQAAVDAYRGEFLAGFSLPATPAFDDWVRLQRETYHQRMRLIFAHLSQEQSERAAHVQAIETTTRWLAHDPLHEPAYQQLMQLHLLVGDRTAALRTYEACRQMLANEFSATPAAETEQLVARIRGDKETRRQGDKEIGR